SQKGYNFYKNLIKNHNRTIKDELARVLKWTNGAPEHLPKYIDAKAYGDKELSRIVHNIFPYRGADTESHMTMFTWVPVVNRAGFECKDNEKFPSEEYTKSEKFEALLEYVEKVNLVGYVGQDITKAKKLGPCKRYHPEGKPYVASNGLEITQEEGWEANQWAGRHFNKFLKDHFPIQFYEVMWIRRPSADE
ncbi:hypothetical protein CROQUDRAFT_44130, partial [Cronartium quercuum f. sp. fusiforme G11]